MKIIYMSPPSKAVIVRPDLLREIIRFFKEKKSKRMVMTAGSCGANSKDMLKSFGYDNILKEKLVQVNMDLKGAKLIELEKGFSIDE